MERTSALIAGILAGIVSPSSFAQPVKFERLQGTDLSRLRSDVGRVGQDFKNVIDLERGNKNSKQVSRKPG